MDTLTIPLFPLSTVLFPGGPIPLRIFEPRYLEMVSHCVKKQTPFGVSLIRDGKEAGTPAEPHEIGTLATIVDWHTLPDGLLGIVAEGGDRFTIQDTKLQSNQLLTAEVALIPGDPVIALPSKYVKLGHLLSEIIEEAGPLYASIQRHFGDASWVSYRLAEILPLDTVVKQYLLEMSSPLTRLTHLQSALRNLFDA